MLLYSILLLFSVLLGFLPLSRIDDVDFVVCTDHTIAALLGMVATVAAVIDSSLVDSSSVHHPR